MFARLIIDVSSLVLPPVYDPLTRLAAPDEIYLQVHLFYHLLSFPRLEMVDIPPSLVISLLVHDTIGVQARKPQPRVV